MTRYIFTEKRKTMTVQRTMYMGPVWFVYCPCCSDGRYVLPYEHALTFAINHANDWHAK